MRTNGWFPLARIGESIHARSRLNPDEIQRTPMPERRTPFPRVFWVANLIEVLERFAYYGIYFGFGIYMTQQLRPIPSFLIGLVVAAAGLVTLGAARAGSGPSWVFLGIFLFAVGEMITSPRIQEYITWIAPKEKAGLYMGSNFLAVMIGGFTSGFIYTTLYGRLNGMGHPEWVWYVLAVHLLLAVGVFWIFIRLAGEFGEQSA